MGPTASGKTALAEELADRHNAVLINADAFQIYRGMDIGTAKSSAKDRYSLMDLKNPDEPFGVGEFVSLASPLLDAAYSQTANVIVVGGTGLYIRALFEEYQNMHGIAPEGLRDRLNERHRLEGLEPLAYELTIRAPEVANSIDLKNPARVKRALERLEVPTMVKKHILPPFATLKVAVLPPEEELNRRFATRTHFMMQNGWVQEVTNLRAAGYLPSHPGFRAIGYRQIWEYITGEVGLEQAVSTTIDETRRYAKRQRTWLRSEPNLSPLDPHQDAVLEVEKRLPELFF